MESGKIKSGIESLLKDIENQQTIIIDGYVGVFYDKIKQQINELLSSKGKKVAWFDINMALKLKMVIEANYC